MNGPPGSASAGGRRSPASSPSCPGCASSRWWPSRCTAHGPLPAGLTQLRERGVTVVPHGVRLSLGGAEPVDPARVAHLAAVRASCWTPRWSASTSRSSGPAAWRPATCCRCRAAGRPSTRSCANVRAGPGRAAGAARAGTDRRAVRLARRRADRGGVPHRDPRPDRRAAAAGRRQRATPTPATGAPTRWRCWTGCRWTGSRTSTSPAAPSTTASTTTPTPTRCRRRCWSWSARCAPGSRPPALMLERDGHYPPAAELRAELDALRRRPAGLPVARERTTGRHRRASAAGTERGGARHDPGDGSELVAALVAGGRRRRVRAGRSTPPRARPCCASGPARWPGTGRCSPPASVPAGRRRSPVGPPAAHRRVRCATAGTWPATLRDGRAAAARPPRSWPSGRPPALRRARRRVRAGCRPWAAPAAPSRCRSPAGYACCAPPHGYRLLARRIGCGRIGVMDLGLTDRVYVLTGASRGLGFATAECLVADGARVVALGPRPPTPWPPPRSSSAARSTPSG